MDAKTVPVAPLLPSPTGLPFKTTLTTTGSIVDFSGYPPSPEGGARTPNVRQVSFPREESHLTPPPLSYPTPRCSSTPARGEQDGKNQKSAEALMKAIGVLEAKETSKSNSEGSASNLQFARLTDLKVSSKRVARSHGSFRSRRSSSHGGVGDNDATQIALKAFQRSQFFKTRMCPHFVKSGKCRKANECNYAHDESELQPSVNLTKTKLCQDFMAGRCHKNIAECGFGNCPAGVVCRHAHGNDEWPTELQNRFFVLRFGGRRKTDCGELLSLRRSSVTPTDSRRNSVAPEAKARQQRFSVTSAIVAAPQAPHMCRQRQNSDIFYRKMQQREASNNVRPHAHSSSWGYISPRTNLEKRAIRDATDDGEAPSDGENDSEADIEKQRRYGQTQSPPLLSMSTIHNRRDICNNNQRVENRILTRDLGLKEEQGLKGERLPSSVAAFYPHQGFTPTRSFPPASTPNYASAGTGFSVMPTSYVQLAAVTSQSSLPVSTSRQTPLQVSQMIQSQAPTGATTQGFYLIPAIPVVHSVPQATRSLVKMGVPRSQSPSGRRPGEYQGMNDSGTSLTQMPPTGSPVNSASSFRTPYAAAQGMLASSPNFPMSPVPTFPALCLPSTFLGSQGGSPTNVRKMSAGESYVLQGAQVTPTAAIAMSTPVPTMNGASNIAAARDRHSSDFYQIVPTANSSQQAMSDLYQVVSPHTFLPMAGAATTTTSPSHPAISHQGCYGYQMNHQLPVNGSANNSAERVESIQYDETISPETREVQDMMLTTNEEPECPQIITAHNSSSGSLPLSPVSIEELSKVTTPPHIRYED